MTTLDGIERTLTADDLLICDANDAPIGIGGIMGGLDSEITDDDHDDRAGDRLVRAGRRSPRPPAASACAARRRLRFERGVDPYGIAAAIARFVELLRDDLSRPRRARRDASMRSRESLPPRRSVARARRPRSTLCSARRSSTERDRRADRADRLRVGEQADGVSTVALPSWRPDCTAEVDVIEEVARHYGYAKIGKTVPKSTMHGRLSPVRSAAAASCARCCSGSGSTRRCPTRSSPTTIWSRAGLAGPTRADRQPARGRGERAAHLAAPRPAEGVAFNESHRRPGVAPVRDRPRLPAGRRRAARRVRGAGGRARRSRRHGGDGTCGARSPRRWASAHGSTSRPSRPGCIRHGRRRCRSGATRRRGRRGAPRRARRLRRRRAGRRARARPHACCSPNEPKVRRRGSRPAASRRATSTSRSSLADSVPAEKVEKAIRQAAGSLLVDVALFDVYRGAGVADGSRSLAYRLRLQAPDRTLTDTELTDVAQQGRHDRRSAGQASLRLRTGTGAHDLRHVVPPRSPPPRSPGAVRGGMTSRPGARPVRARRRVAARQRVRTAPCSSSSRCGRCTPIWSCWAAGLVVRAGDSGRGAHRQTAEQVGATSVHVSEDFGPYGRRRDETVARCAGKHPAGAHRFALRGLAGPGHDDQRRAVPGLLRRSTERGSVAIRWRLAASSSRRRVELVGAEQHQGLAAVEVGGDERADAARRRGARGPTCTPATAARPDRRARPAPGWRRTAADPTPTRAGDERLEHPGQPAGVAFDVGHEAAQRLRRPTTAGRRRSRRDRRPTMHPGWRRRDAVWGEVRRTSPRRTGRPRPAAERCWRGRRSSRSRSRAARGPWAPCAGDSGAKYETALTCSSRCQVLRTHGSATVLIDPV